MRQKMEEVQRQSPADQGADRARHIIQAAQAGAALQPVVRGFFDQTTFTVSYVVHDPATRGAAIIDPILDFDPAAGRISHTSADAIVDYIKGARLTIQWLLETHPHADHLSGARYLQEKLGGTIAIGREIVVVQQYFGRIFNSGADFAHDGSDFDRLLMDGEAIRIGSLEGTVLHVPGHTPADVAYVIGDAVFCGDTLFMPDSGTARTDFPGGDARQLYRSIRRLLHLPEGARLFVCHDYSAPGREGFAWETTISAQRKSNVHIHDDIDEDAFVAMRTARDRTLAMPRLLLPSLQVNIRAGRLPAPEDNGTRYLWLPLDAL